MKWSKFRKQEQMIQTLGLHVPGNSLAYCDVNFCAAAAAAAIQSGRSSNGGDCWEETSSGFSFESCRSAIPEGFWGFVATLLLRDRQQGGGARWPVLASQWDEILYKDKVEIIGKSCDTLGTATTYMLLSLYCKKCISPIQPLLASMTQLSYFLQRQPQTLMRWPFTSR